MLETKKRVNEFKIKHMKILNEQVAAGGEKEEEEAKDPLANDRHEFDPNTNDAMINTQYGMQVRYHAR